MCPDPERQRGFALMAALFILVTLTAIGAYLLTISTGQVAAGAQDEQGGRAYEAARAGIEWGAYQVLVVSNTCPAGLQVRNLPDNFRAEVTCSSRAETEGSRQITGYTIVSTGCNATGCGAANPPATYVERRLQLTLSKCTSGC
jgi:MSHA biogenesis protein MshP